MSGVRRFLSKREGKYSRDRDHRALALGKKPAFASSPELASKAVDSNSASDFYGLFDAHGPPTNQAEEHKVETLRQRIINSKGVMLRDAQILWALRSISANGDLDAAYGLLLAMSDASEGIVTSYDPRTQLLGAQNRQGVTCYLDATLFSMFSRLDSFEAMLYNSFDDVSRNKLGFVLRLWVNLLRSGRLITTDITKVMQDTLAECGWDGAATLHQQDASEAFTFITGKLELPLLTLKMDIYHTGKEDTTDDHKFVNERLLEVAIPPDPTGQRSEITLEECLEDYFNNRIEVRRYMERRSTINSIRKTTAVHVETVELDSDSSPITPLSSSPSYTSPMRPTTRLRTPSIIQERYFPPQDESGYSSLAGAGSRDSTGRPRAGSIRKEVMMPAWQFFSLIPWYTDNAPTNDAQVAAHFSSKRPVLGLCLKRYSMTSAGKAIRLNTQVDIPVEIGVPHFIQDDHMDETGQLYGNFKLSLQSAVCHRGNSVDSGHYIALVRGTAPPMSLDGNFTDSTQTWMRFDDLAPHRITMVDIEKALREETPYLLFYQIVPIEGDPGHITSGEDILTSTSDRNASVSELSTDSALTENQPPSSRLSFEISGRDDPRGRSPAETRRTSVVSFQEQPAEHTSETSLGVSNHSGGANTPKRQSVSLSRTQSKMSDGLGRTLSKFGGKKSREKLPGNTIQAEVHVTEVTDRTMTDKQPLPKQNTLRVELPKGHRREKSRSRLSRSKVRGEKPDRECSVM
ncbi:uncharacterized protein Z518_01154 [Rhinocladiella mackenziei CBS 650.93]|uniref:ubiquitinyl hydrolase 1 n=1 Tax=Rhinocladiella mackenziei CBS 650.93 TaxID=1442369 RepID=A0A0D2HHF9_9EURO|nr:uncharacterized protein Z518_01154 [Rhinocladiella mackenziei CBS 650.93]KIX10073.1 hypothetical protein Z518_01154 [Rhinocladiella mackenziei CBS 650.93]